MAASSDRWPELPYAAWKDTCQTLQLWTQIVGKIRLARTPWLNHSWHVTLYVTARGLTTSPIPDGARTFQIDFDFIDHVLWLRTSDGHFRQVVLKPMTVAEFYGDVLHALSAARHRRAGSTASRTKSPTRSRSPRIACTRPTIATTPTASGACSRASNEVFAQFRTGFLGKASPVHFFWGSFDLAVTRFSGRSAPRHPGGVPNLPDDVAQEAYSHEVSSAGFWPGGGAIDYPAYYSYAYPAPEGFSAAPVRPAQAFFSKELGEFILPYDAVRTAADPRAALMDFLQSTYDAAADLGKWDRAALECAIGEARVVRQF